VASMLSSTLADHPCRVVSHRSVGEALKLLVLETQKEAFHCAPGQFVMLDLSCAAKNTHLRHKKYEPFLFRRPFSVLATREKTVFEIYYKIVGLGTRMMAEWKKGDAVLSLGPLGKAFTPPKHPETALLIGGGIGIAPLYFLAKLLKQAAQQQAVQPAPACFYGVRSRQDIGLQKQLFDVFGRRNVFISTDNGSHGTAGTVCDLLEKYLDKVNAAQEAYICGPTPMMKAVVSQLKAINPAISIEVSLEEHMPCGTGACTGCVIGRTDQTLPSKICVEGPVFKAEQILWPEEGLIHHPEGPSCLV